MKNLGFIIFFICFISLQSFGQGDLYYAGAIKSKRDATHRNIVRNIINRNLSLPISDSTTEDWVSALNAIQVLNYKSPWVNSRISEALEANFNHRPFNKALLETIYGLYPFFSNQVKTKIVYEHDPLLFVLMAEYILQHDSSSRQFVLDLAAQRVKQFPHESYYELFSQRHQEIKYPDVSEIFSNRFLPGEVLMITILRKDRSLPGLSVIRDSGGNFLRDSNGIIFNVGQLGRSVNNLPYYFKGGNTPQGLYRMNGYGISQSEFIGPTPNIQMLMPNETSGPVFFKDSMADDSITKNEYGKLLPAPLRKKNQLYEAWQAGTLGRNEIIAHGTTVNPDYYKAEPFYPLTPTLGCLSTIEIWNTENGKREKSDQAKLISAIDRAGGPTGYVFVFEIDDSKEPVRIGDILHLIP